MAPAHDLLPAIAVRLIRRLAGAKQAVTYVARSEARAMELAALLREFAPGLNVILFRPWDCLPYDRSPPSREAMGSRLDALAALEAPGESSPLVVTTPDAAIQRLPPPSILETAFEIRAGDTIEIAALQQRVEACGYTIDERIDEPGEIAFRGQVVDIFPAGGSQPFRLDIGEGVVERIRAFDPATQLSRDEVARIRIGPASELAGSAQEWLPGAEHHLASYYPSVCTLMDYTPDAATYLEPGAANRAASVLGTIAESYRDRLRWQDTDNGGRLTPKPDQLYLTKDEWRDFAQRNPFELDLSEVEQVPHFAQAAAPWQSFLHFVRAQIAARHRIVLSAAGDRDLKRLMRSAARVTDVERRDGGWPRQSACKSKRATIRAFMSSAQSGFVDEREHVALVTASDVLGSRAETAAAAGADPLLEFADTAFALGDVVIHADHGFGVLRSLDTLHSEELGARETLRIEYAGGAMLMAPIEDIGKIWRYGSDPDSVTLDSLKGSAWPKRRAKVEAQISATAHALAAATHDRLHAGAPKLEPPSASYEAFVARFPFTLTPDQERAIDDVLADLASGKPMDRIVIGDVGYGKTEVALRAAAAVAFCGKQVAVAAPTTVLVRQHLETFQRRFADMDVHIGNLSRLVKPASAKKTKEKLRSGEIGIVIGTHALAGKNVVFAELGLVVIDEEHRFGTADKRKLRALAKHVHTLTLSATPIPRTLQSALVGLQDLSIIATAPARRRPIRTFMIKPDAATMRQALLRESRRGGQSFVVVPRIAEIEPVAAILRQTVPGLELLIAHGQIPPQDIDEVMVRFANGRGDVLLATNIIESGLDVPRANTMLIWSAELFGLAQLHQLRGRVGRGRAQGLCYLLSEVTEADDAIAAKRLSTLASLDRLGAGMAIAARDLDARGAGDLVGVEQAGHIKLIGLGLYQRLLEDALRAVRGEREDWTPEVKLDLSAGLPVDYIPEPDLRINLYYRLQRARRSDEIDRLADELEDRFGALPDATAVLIAAARLRTLCRGLDIARLDAGPEAVALTWREGSPLKSIGNILAEDIDGVAWSGERLLLRRRLEDASARAEAAQELLEAAAERRDSPPQHKPTADPLREHRSA
jgi:transcription-repair coupling factor (superfamily II helicase)